jgi:DNA-binding MarR family transcriptional regulator
VLELPARGPDNRYVPRRPKEALAPHQAAVLMTVATQDRPTVRSVAERLNLSPSYVHTHLRHLRAAGLVTWVPGQAATLRPTFGFVVRRAPQKSRS